MYWIQASPFYTNNQCSIDSATTLPLFNITPLSSPSLSLRHQLLLELVIKKLRPKVIPCRNKLLCLPFSPFHLSLIFAGKHRRNREVTGISPLG